MYIPQLQVSTCNGAIYRYQEEGFTNIKHVVYNQGGILLE